MFGCVGYVQTSLPITYGMAKLYVMEYNDAVIKMCVKERSPALRHVSRTHRVDLDWLFERINRDPGVFIKFVPTKEQLADILTKGSFTAEAWNAISKSCLILPRSAVKIRNQTQQAHVAIYSQAATVSSVSFAASSCVCMASSSNSPMTGHVVAGREAVHVEDTVVAAREGACCQP